MGSGPELLDRRLLRFGVIGMQADRRIDVVVRMSDRDDRGPRRKLDADAQRMRDLVLPHRIEERRQLGGELREIEVTVGIDEHRCQVSEVSCQLTVAAEFTWAADRPPLRQSLTQKRRSMRRRDVASQLDATVN